jgi:hypothetical protein
VPSACSAKKTSVAERNGNQKTGRTAVRTGARHQPPFRRIESLFLRGKFDVIG